MLPDYSIKRTYAIKCGADYGTGFTLDFDGRRFLLSAKHVCASYLEHGRIQCLTSSGWIDVKSSLVAFGSTENILDDFCILEIGSQLQDSSETQIAAVEDNHIAQEVLAFGFPVHWPSPLTQGNAGFPPALIKAGLISGVTSAEGFGYLYVLDMLLNEGMSGGPVFARAKGNRDHLLLSGMAVSYYSPQKRIDGPEELEMSYKPNTGLAFCIPARRLLHALGR